MQAETIAYSSGVTTEPNARTGVYVADIHNGDWIKVRNVDFGSGGPSRFKVSVASALRGGVIEVRMDSVAGPLVARIDVPGTGGWESWKTLEAKALMEVTGVHDIYFVFTGRKGPKLFNFDWWEFKNEFQAIFSYCNRNGCRNEHIRRIGLDMRIRKPYARGCRPERCHSVCRQC